eukprot:2060915-Pleurochrysis_carterae.AAC.1
MPGSVRPPPRLCIAKSRKQTCSTESLKWCACDAGQAGCATSLRSLVSMQTPISAIAGQP